MGVLMQVDAGVCVSLASRASATMPIRGSTNAKMDVGVVACLAEMAGSACLCSPAIETMAKGRQGLSNY